MDYCIPGTLALASTSNNNDLRLSLQYARHSPYNSFQLHAYEQGTRERLNQIHDDLRALRRECDHALRDLNTKHESWEQRWTSERLKVRPLSCIPPRSALMLVLTAQKSSPPHIKPLSVNDSEPISLFCNVGVTITLLNVILRIANKLSHLSITPLSQRYKLSPCLGSRSPRITVPPGENELALQMRHSSFLLDP